MLALENNLIEHTLSELFIDAQFDEKRILKGLAKSRNKEMKPIDFKDAYLSISKEQGHHLIRLILQNDFKNIIEFGTSFGISTLFLAQGVQATGGSIITTELIASKAEKAIENFKKAGVDHRIELRIGNAMDTLKGHSEPIDLLFLDGWKDLYLSLFQMLAPNFHNNTIIYVDNADMYDTQKFLNAISKTEKYHLQSVYGDKTVLITFKK